MTMTSIFILRRLPRSSHKYTLISKQSCSCFFYRHDTSFCRRILRFVFNILCSWQTHYSTLSVPLRVPALSTMLYRNSHRKCSIARSAPQGSFVCEDIAVAFVRWTNSNKESWYVTLNKRGTTWNVIIKEALNLSWLRMLLSLVYCQIQLLTRLIIRRKNNQCCRRKVC